MAICPLHPEVNQGPSKTCRKCGVLLAQAAVRPKIRKADRSDLENLSNLATVTYVDAFGGSFSPEELQDRIQKTRSVEYFEKALEKDVVLVAEDASLLVGYAEFGKPDLAIDGILDGDQELVRLYVLKGHQGRGIGKALLEAALSHPKMKSAGNIYLDVWEKNESAIRFYRSYGFVETGTVVDGDIIMVRKKRDEF
jgi:diamine N-acetyltransferase